MKQHNVRSRQRLRDDNARDRMKKIKRESDRERTIRRTTHRERTETHTERKRFMQKREKQKGREDGMRK